MMVRFQPKTAKKYHFNPCFWVKKVHFLVFFDEKCGKNAVFRVHFGAKNDVFGRFCVKKCA